MNELNKNETKMLKGIAILFMVGLHLFNRLDIDGYYSTIFVINGNPLIYYLSFIFDSCVPIFCFCSGYAAYLQKEQPYINKLKRLFNLLKRYWIIVVITCLIGIIVKNKYIPYSFNSFLGNFLLFKTSYVGAWWFMKTYLLLMLLSPIIIYLIDHINKYIFLFFTLTIYLVAYYFNFINSIDIKNNFLYFIFDNLLLISRCLLPFVFGAIFYKFKTISFLRNVIKNKPNLVGTFIISISVILHIIIKSLIIAPFTSLIFIIGYSLLSIANPIKKILLFFGKHSTNIWLTHMQFYMIFFKDFVFHTNTTIGCLIILLLLSISLSYLIDFIFKQLDKISKFLRDLLCKIKFSHNAIKN